MRRKPLRLARLITMLLASGITLLIAAILLSTLPATAGTTITWTAEANGGTASPLQYRFLLYTEGRGWTLLRDWGTANTVDWATTSASVGNNVVQVWVRSGGSSSTDYEDWMGSGYFIIRR
jgi:hypothetical protein